MMIDLLLTNKKFRYIVENDLTNKVKPVDRVWVPNNNIKSKNKIWMPCRAKWNDGEIAKTLSAFHISTKYDSSLNEAPFQSLRYINYNLAIDEIDWIYKKKSNKVKDLNSKIWNQWADENGTIGKGYGYQVAKKVYNSKLTDTKIDQIDFILENLILDPTNRRLLINLFNIDELSEMNLAPCAYEIFFMVDYTRDNDTVKSKLNMVLNQRSGDFLVAAHPGGWNEFQYYFLYRLIADLIGFELDTFIHNTYNLHIYDRHSELVTGILLESGPQYGHHFIESPFKIREDIQQKINNIRTKYIKMEELILDTTRDVYIVSTLDNIDLESKKNYTKELIELYYKYDFTEWYDFTTFGNKMLEIANKVTNIPVAE